MEEIDESMFEGSDDLNKINNPYHSNKKKLININIKKE